MNLNSLSLFVSVVQDGSLSKASERLNVPIATISRQITELEKSLNIQLFDRKKSGVKPTMAGQKLYEQVYQNIDNLLQVEKVFSEHQEISGKLRISTFAGLQEVWAWVDEFCIHTSLSVFGDACVFGFCDGESGVFGSLKWFDGCFVRNFVHRLPIFATVYDTVILA